MDEMLRIAVFGDSLMKGTLPDEQLRYHFHTDLFEAPLAGLHAEVTNKSVFGATSRKGVTLVQRDLARGHRYDWALVEYGGNDCNYDWPDVARTREGRLQVELAQYKYLLPRLLGIWKHLERQEGAIGTRGPGETQLESDRRHIHKKISKLEAELKDVRRVRATQRERRIKNEVPVVAIVGYRSLPLCEKRMLLAGQWFGRTILCPQRGDRLLLAIATAGV